VALKQFQVAAKTNGLHAWNATATLIQLQLKRKQFDIVKTMLREARDRFVGNSQVAYLHATEGNMYALLNKPGKAISAYEEALALQSLPQYWIRMAHLWWEMSRYKCAFRIMNRISKKPKYKHLQSQLTKWKKIHKERMEQAFRPFGRKLPGTP
jgi:tetratricopeptide (TPR) repeat protein